MTDDLRTCPVCAAGPFANGRGLSAHQGRLGHYQGTAPADVVARAQSLSTQAKALVRSGQYVSYQDAIKSLTQDADQAPATTADNDGYGHLGDGASGRTGDPDDSLPPEPRWWEQAPDEHGVIVVPPDASDYEDNPGHDPDITARNQARLRAAAAVPGAVTFSAQAQDAGQADPQPVNDQASTQETATVAADTTKQCATCGDTLAATTANFKAKAANADGLNERCKTCSNAYHQARNAKLAAEAAPDDADKATKATTAAQAWEARKAMGVGRLPAKAPRATAVDNGPAVDGTAAQAAAHADLERRLAAVGGPETDEGQAILAEAAQAAKAAKVRTPRAKAAKAAKATPTGVPAALAALPGVRKATPAPKPSQAKRAKAAKAS